MPDTTPMMKQYNRIKRQNADSVLFFRLGDFYEMFESDAREVSSILNLTLTKRNKIQMCGIPYHAAHTYIPRLLKAGKKIAICEQVSLPKNGKGIARREVVEIITPGTIVDEDFLDKNSNNYLAAVGKYRNYISCSYIDLSTGEFHTSSFPVEERLEKLKKEMFRLQPSEILIQESLLEEDNTISRIITETPGLMVNRYPDWSFDFEDSLNRLKKQFNVINLKGFGIENDNPSIFTCGILLEYLEETSKGLLPHIREIRLYIEDDYLGLDESTRKNLELIRNLQDGTRSYTLLDVMDYTKTSIGSRLIKKWLLNPLNDREKILERQKKTSRLYKNQILLSSLREGLTGILDIERLSARIALDKAHAKDLVAVRNSAQSFLGIVGLLSEWQDSLLPADPERDKAVVDIIGLLDCSIKDDPSILLTEGKIIRDGYNSELDRLRELKSDSKAVLDNYLTDEKKKSGIPNMKIKYNRIIGHFIEITKSYTDNVPEYFVRRQSLVGSERYTTERLSEIEIDINNASEKIIEIEKRLFLEIRERIKGQIPVLLEIALFISELDCIQSFSHCATVNGYIRPEINNSGKIDISGGRHPVVEANLPPGEFVPNSISLNSAKTSFALITGPNMAGKSTYLRQTALIVLMAQIGSFVPAREAFIGIADKIFCRVGASDNLARGESTFLVEMNETANILRSASEKSLIIMDEVGRGTSTNDGLSIAWAVSEYLIDISARTLFATHYHELTLVKSAKLENLSMEVLEKKGEIIFLKKVKKGPAGNSYGIHVAQLAGLPAGVIRRAEVILKNFETRDDTKSVPPESNKETSANQEKLFIPSEMVVDEIKSIDYNDMTPLEALEKISAWKKELNMDR